MARTAIATTARQGRTSRPPSDAGGPSEPTSGARFRFPRGWFLVCFSNELANAQVVPLRFFGRALVLYRSESGEARLLDAYCPHMGAHLGHGGQVEGASIRCPYHGWKYSGEGVCTEVPYATHIPPKARVQTWPLLERNGMIFVWHDPARGAPDWEIPVIDEYADGDFLPWDHSQLQVRTPAVAVVENLADVGHFVPVHGAHPERGSFRNTFEGHVAVQLHRGVAYPLGGGEDEYEVEATYYGPGYLMTRLRGVATGVIVTAHTPIDEERLLLRFAVSLRKMTDRASTERFMRRYVDNLREGFLRMVPIWENMQHLESPLLCDGDGPVGSLRAWYEHFHHPLE